MTREEAKRRLLNIESFIPINKLEEARDIEALDMAIMALEQTTWIPCSERLPEENKAVIASTEYGVFPEAKYTKEYGWEWAYEAGADYWKELEDVEAWMPLPKKYETKSLICI